MVCTPKVETEGVQGVVHSIHHVLPLHAISHMADSVATHTIGQILPFHKDKGKDSKDKKKKKKMVIDLTSLKSVTLSTDTAKPKNFSLQVEIVSAYSHNDKKTNMENNPANFEEKFDSDEDDDDVDTATALVLAEKKKRRISFKRMSVDSYNTGQSAVKTAIKMGNPGKHLSHSFFVIKAVDLSHTTKNAYGKRPVWGESVYVDVNDEDFDMTSVKIIKEMEAKHAATVALNTNTIKKSHSSHESDIHHNIGCNKSIDIEKEKTHGPQATGNGFQVFLYRGVSSMEYLIGYQFIPYSLLLPGRYNADESVDNQNCSYKSGTSQNQNSSDGSNQSTNKTSQQSFTDPTESSTINSNTTSTLKYPVSSHPSNTAHNFSSGGSVSTESYSQSGSGMITSSLNR